ncbi:hypothetical protein [Cellulophaga baltica]|uniref:hypothetical protein n=1 Tax=Cellulophaga baltica TaxID=76594 RepID=UPI0015F522E7|nr:hypothetical protein [Cellulophaga baltica]MBA6314044.1 hypothetical protein [Cellulophaga baltica]
MLRISKNTIQFILVAFWLFALAAPTIVTFIDDDSSVLVNNMNEEEQQEQHQCKKINEVEKFIASDFSFRLYISDQRNISVNDRTTLNNSLHTAKIILPPPEGATI